MYIYIYNIYNSKVTQNWVVKEVSETKHHSYLPSIMQ